MTDLFLETIVENDLSENLRELVRVIGMDTMRRVIKELPRGEYYVPTPERLSDAVDRFVKTNYVVAEDGSNNIRELMRDTGASRRRIQDAVKRIQDPRMRRRR
jgi:hypothetical protein